MRSMSMIIVIAGVLTGVIACTVAEAVVAEVLAGVELN